MNFRSSFPQSRTFIPTEHYVILTERSERKDLPRLSLQMPRLSLGMTGESLGMTSELLGMTGEPLGMTVSSAGGEVFPQRGGHE